jgi:hypothetical protein
MTISKAHFLLLRKESRLNIEVNLAHAFVTFYLKTYIVSRVLFNRLR